MTVLLRFFLFYAVFACTVWLPVVGWYYLDT